MNISEGLQERAKSFTMSSMTGKFRTTASRGEINILLIPFIFLVLFFIAAAGFGLWAFSERESYRTDVETKIAAAEKVAREEQSIVKDKEHAEADKLPLKSYVGPEPFGSVTVFYPKTWSGYVVDTGTSNQPLDGYFQPGVVPNVGNIGSTFALRVQVVNQQYSKLITTMNSAVNNKTVTATPYAFPRVPSVVGVRFEGTIVPAKKITGTMIMVPLRDKTLQVWTESPTYGSDFNTHILPNVTFSP